MTMQRSAPPALPPAASAGALTRINAFSGLLWIVGVVFAIIAITAAIVRIDALSTATEPIPDPPSPQTVVEGTSGGAGSTVFEFTGVGDAILALPPELLDRPIAVHLVEGESGALLRLNNTVSEASSYATVAGRLGTAGGAPTIVATYADSQLSIVTSNTWVVQISPYEPTLVAAPIVSGVGDAIVLSPTSATAAIITADGDPRGNLWVDVLSIAGSNIVVTEEVAASPVTFDWDASPYVLLIINVQDDTAWTLETLGGTR